jgi:hypothetical protein
MGRVLGAIAGMTRSGQLLAQASSVAKLSGTTMSLTGINSTLAGRWDKMTDAFEKEINKSGGVFVSSCNKKLPIKFVYYDDQSIAATAVSLYEKLATVDNVDLFVGPDWSTHGFPVSQIFEKYKIPSVMSNVATPKVYESGFKYIAGIALDATTWSKNYFDMLGQLNPNRRRFSGSCRTIWSTQRCRRPTSRTRRRQASRPSAPKCSPARPRTSRAHSQDQGAASGHHLHFVVRRRLGAADPADAPAAGPGHGRASHHGVRSLARQADLGRCHRRDLLA